jgi:gliding motility-associated lipoprotein GldH
MIRVSFLLLLIVLITSCGNNDVYEQDLAVKAAKWPADQKLRFEFNSADTTTSKDVFVSLRHNDFYKYNNIFLFITTIAPNGASLTDTAEFIIADKKGKWLGSGAGNLYDLRLLYKNNIKFGQAGRYVFYVQQGMRENELKGITDVGIRIAKAKE